MPKFGYLPDILAARIATLHELQQEKEETELQIWCLNHPAHRTQLGVIEDNKDPVFSLLDLEEKIRELNREIGSARIEVQNVFREMGSCSRLAPFEQGTLFA